MTCSRRLGRITRPRGSRGGRYRVAHDLLYGGVLQSTRALLHKALVAEEHGNVNAWANVAAAPSADAARALEGQGGVTGRGWKADLAQGLERRGVLPIREEGLWSSAAPGGAAAAWGAGGASVNSFNPSIPIVCRRATVTLPDADTGWQGQEGSQRQDWRSDGWQRQEWGSDAGWQGWSAAAADGGTAAPGAADARMEGGEEARDRQSHQADDEAAAWAAWQRQRRARESQGWSSSGWRQ